MPKAQVANRVTTAFVACGVLIVSQDWPRPERGSTVELDVTCLEHLDKGNGQVQVRNVAANQTQAKHDADGHNGTPANCPSLAGHSTAHGIFHHHSHVGMGGHGDLVARIKDGGESGHELGHARREEHVPCRQEKG